MDVAGCSEAKGSGVMGILSALVDLDGYGCAGGASARIPSRRGPMQRA